MVNFKTKNYDINKVFKVTRIIKSLWRILPTFSYELSILILPLLLKL